MNQTPQNDDEYARRSFTMRRMADWQLWSITVVVAVVLIAILIWALV